MKSRLLSSFTVIGIILLILGCAGLLLGSHFIFDPGQISDGREPLIYLIVGVIMIANGLLTPSAPAEENKENATRTS